MRKLSALLLLSIGITGYAYTRMSTITDEVEKINKAESVRTERVMKRKAKLEKELSDLYKNYNSRTEMTEKLRMDSEVRWYRDEYKEILKKYDTRLVWLVARRWRISPHSLTSFSTDVAA